MAKYKLDAGQGMNEQVSMRNGGADGSVLLVVTNDE
jgi:hypothetical protein